MKILMFGWEFPPFNSGGLGVACQGLSRALSEMGEEVIFVLPRKTPIGKEPASIIFADMPDIEIIETDAHLYPYVDSHTYLRTCPENAPYGKTLLEEVKRYGKLARKIASENNFDLIHAHDWLSFLAGVEAKKVSGKPLVVHVHATEYDRSGGKGVDRRVYEIERQGMELADKVLAVSSYTKNMLVANYGIADGKVDVVHNGFTKELDGDMEISRHLDNLKRDGNKIVLFVGRFTLQKGPDYLLKAAQKALTINNKIYFVMAGSGDMEGQIIDESIKLGISEHVLFAGFLRGEELKAVYKSADLFVMPSVSEPFGITPLESLVNGTPVLVSRQSGVSEVISHALKTDFWDVDDMASKILAVLDHKSLRDLLGKNGSREVKGVTWEKAAQKCVEIYRDLLNN